MTRRIDVGLSRESVQEAIDALLAYADSIDERAERATSAIADEGIESARQQLASYPQPFATGRLAASFRKSRVPGGYEVSNDCDHAAFFEFGTGVRGQRQSYPYRFPDVGWAYDVNSHGDSGWFYIGDDGARHWTRGMPSRPFMAPAALRMRQCSIAKFKAAFR